MIRGEISKIVHNRVLMIILAVLLCINGVIIYVSDQKVFDESVYSATEYHKLKKNLAGKDNKEVIEYLEERKTKLADMELAEMVVSFSQEDALLITGWDEDTLKKNIEKYFKGGYLEYTENIDKEKKLIEDALSEYITFVNVENERKKVLDKSYQILKKSENKYEKERTEKLIRIYSCEKKQTNKELNKGIAEYFSNNLTMLFIYLFILLVGLTLVTREKEKGIISLTKATVKGGMFHCLVKWLVMLLFGILVLLLFCIENYVIYGMLYGYADVHNTISSVTGFELSAYNISISGSLLYFFAMKALYIIVIVSIQFIILICLEKAVNVYIVTALIAGMSYYFFIAINENSYLWYLKTYNILHLNDIAQYLTRPQYSNILGYPVRNEMVLGITEVLMSIVLVAIACYIYSKKSNLFHSVDKNVIFKKNVYGGLFFQELHKGFVLSKCIVLVFITIGVSIIFYKPANKYSSVLSDGIYVEYSTALVGPYSEDKMKIVDDMENNNEEKYSRNQCSELLYEATSTAIMKMKEYCSYLEEKDSSVYIQNNMFNKMTLGEGRQYEIIKLCVLSMVVAMGSTLMVAYDYEKERYRIIKSTIRYKKFWISKILVAGIYTIVVFLIMYLPEGIKDYYSFGIEYIDAPAYSMMHLESVPPFFSIGQVIIMVIIAKLIYLIFIMLVSMYVTKKIKNVGYACAVMGVIIVFNLVIANNILV